jgi:CRISPR-associated protein Cmr4
VFGPERITNPDDAYAGAISFTDARLLAFPVRSLKGVFAWVTCPQALDRLRRDLGLTAFRALPDPPKPGPNTAIVPQNTPLRQGSGLVLEEFAFEALDGADPIAGWIAERAIADPSTGQRFAKQLAIVDDDAFGHFAQHATEVTARIALDYETKTVREGALFYEEFLPPETLLYSLVLAERSRSKTQPMSAPEVAEALAGLGLRTVQIGASETIGKGLCALRFARPNGAAR